MSPGDWNPILSVFKHVCLKSKIACFKLPTSHKSVSHHKVVVRCKIFWFQTSDGYLKDDLRHTGVAQEPEVKMQTFHWLFAHFPKHWETKTDSVKLLPENWYTFDLFVVFLWNGKLPVSIGICWTLEQSSCIVIRWYVFNDLARVFILAGTL